VIVTAKEKLAKKAYKIKSAWLVACSWVGFIPESNALVIPDYKLWSKNTLEHHIDDLYNDFLELLKKIIIIESKSQVGKALDWFADKFKICLLENRSEPFTLCTAIEFENEIGKLYVRKYIEVPAYAEVLYQGWRGGVAIRHPEYMISRDLEFLFYLHCSTEKYLNNVDWGRMEEKDGSASENSQTIARCVIQTCFNLLESFSSGIARQFILTHNNINTELVSKLIDNSLSLKKRLIEIPKLVTGRQLPIDQNKSPMKELFGSIKHHRDSFVHCEPGKQDSKWGYVKEDMFNDVSKEFIEKAVQSTVSLVKIIWNHVYGADAPKWLPDMNNFVKMERRNLNFEFPKVKK
jgi:hypothetical protein